MTQIILTGAKYLIIVLFAYFTYISFRAQRDVPDERKKLSYALQRITMLVIHALAFLTMCIQIKVNPDVALTMGQAIGLYAGQLVYLIAMSCVVPAVVSLSKGLNNVMCMFLTIGFIIQTRLNFDVSLRQLIIVAVGSVVFLLFVFLCKRAKFLRNLTWIYAIVGMALLAVMLVLSRVVYGAKLAIDLGFFSFQPAEFVKILFVLFVASAFHKANNFKTVAVTAICAGIHVLILVFCHDLGSALILFMIYMLMLYAATKKILYVGVGVGALVVASIAAYKIFAHVRVRVHTWLDPWADIENTGYQITQALFAIGTGGWFGSGLFGGKPQSVPVVSNDMIFSAISEEMGGLFSLLLILLCLCFVLMIFRVAIRVNNTFYKLLAFGLGSAYGFQVFLTIGGTVKFIPLTGVNLPFISSGGSSLLASLIMLGLVQALYVISEADVEREREMIAAGASIRSFDGYNEMEPSHKEKALAKSLEKDDVYEPRKSKDKNKGRVQEIDPEEFEDEIREPRKSKDKKNKKRGRVQEVMPPDTENYNQEYYDDVPNHPSGYWEPYELHPSQRERIHQMMPEESAEDLASTRRIVKNKKSRVVLPEEFDDYNQEYYNDHVAQRERIHQMVPDEEFDAASLSCSDKDAAPIMHPQPHDLF